MSDIMKVFEVTINDETSRIYLVQAKSFIDAIDLIADNNDILILEPEKHKRINVLELKIKENYRHISIIK